MAAEELYNFHRSQPDGWEHGEIKEVWTDADGSTCIRYADEKWWHYNVDKKELKNITIKYIIKNERLKR